MLLLAFASFECALPHELFLLSFLDFSIDQCLELTGELLLHLPEVLLVSALDARIMPIVHFLELGSLCIQRIAVLNDLALRLVSCDLV